MERRAWTVASATLTSCLLVSGVLVLGPLALGSCTALEPFQCANDGQCMRGGQSGTCEATGYCSFGDATCMPIARRYADTAPAGLAGHCVGDPADLGAGGGGHDAADVNDLAHGPPDLTPPPPPLLVEGFEEASAPSGVGSSGVGVEPSTVTGHAHGGLKSMRVHVRGSGDDGGFMTGSYGEAQTLWMRFYVSLPLVLPASWGGIFFVAPHAQNRAIPPYLSLEVSKSGYRSHSVAGDTKTWTTTPRTSGWTCIVVQFNVDQGLMRVSFDGTAQPALDLSTSLIGLVSGPVDLYAAVSYQATPLPTGDFYYDDITLDNKALTCP